MSRVLSRLVFITLISVGAGTANAQDWQADDYSLSMSGALINDHCSRTWEGGDYISIHACNYRLANLFNASVSSQQFEECTVRSQGDIVRIADCMVERFNAWIAQQEL